MKLEIKKTHEHARLPERAHESDAGYDLFAAERVVIASGVWEMVPLGFAAAFPSGYAALIWDRSSMATKFGITKIAGVIDAGYRGEWKVALYNTSAEPYEVKPGDKVAQVLFQKVEAPTVHEVSELPESERGEGGFGSTGK